MPQHVIVRGNNRTLLFRGELDRRVFMRYLRDGAALHGCDVHAFVLMDNHVHLMATARDAGATSRMMHALGMKFARFVNAAHERTGTLFEGRYRASVVDSERYLLTCMRYIESNPVRAGMVADPAHYPWSSHQANACGKPSDWLVPREEYLALGRDPAARAKAYRALFGRPVEGRELQSIRTNLQRCRPLGDDRFLAQLEATTGMTLRALARGRPRRHVKNEPDPI